MTVFERQGLLRSHPDCRSAVSFSLYAKRLLGSLNNVHPHHPQKTVFSLHLIPTTSQMSPVKVSLISWRDIHGDKGSYERVVEAFIALELSGACGLLAILLTAIFGPDVKRYSTWYSFGASWIFSCISYTLLFTSGQLYRPLPDYGLCVVQTALIYAAPTLTACTTLSLIVHMLLNVRRVLADAPFKTKSGAVLALLIVPYIVWLVSFTGVLLYGISNPETIRKSLNGTYCDSTNPMLSKISSLVVVSCMVLIIAIQGIIALRLYRNRHIISGSSHSVTMAIRVMVFSLLGALALGVAVAYVITWQHDQVFDMILASLPVIAVLIFGTQMDLVHVWMCRRRVIKKHSRPISQYAAVASLESL
ncbi:hypothetical protein BDZ94DRAFT_1271413 [Collybia nuda]|uniref:Uncharacterized protein n=1 Tax=Collybia nuda TaxID=64659 RepID=A0A9P5XYR5_9AGAR|nr:hypothetical protein BDZ94DRAFT_1271413 [Collybia nuda]